MNIFALPLEPGATTWLYRAACHSTDPTVFDGETPEDIATARRICTACPVRRDCLRHALATERADRAQERSGVRGGHTPAERYALYVKHVAGRRKQAA